MPEHRPALLVCRRRRPDAAVRLYCFAHSGGSPGEFVRWGDELPEAEIWGVQLPGRGSRIDEPGHTRIEQAVAEIVEHAGFRGRFAFFGHSLGALLAFETARVLRDRGLPQPERLYLSACVAPDLPRGVPPIHHLGDRELFAAIQGQYGSLPTEIADDEELLALIMATHRADFEMVDSHRHTPGAPLALPLHVVSGTEDRIPAAALERWRSHSEGPFDLRWLPGGHFYLREQREALLRHIRDSLLDPDPVHV
ncbi:thioesterase II family protein [Streptomyces sp. AGS-58]|uniref:thioesterase II family protein n=1 Tax=unclassified Streptomyces TaxID=2593676 RepID=UPI0035A2C7F3